MRITGALAIDGPRGKLYAQVRTNGRVDVGVFSARDGSYLGSLGIAGAVAVDAEGGRVLVDDPTRGLHVLDAESGEARALVPIVTGTPAPTATPQSGWPTPAPPSPLYFPPAVDPATGTVIVVRREGLWRVERGGNQARAVDFVPSPPWSGSNIDRFGVGFSAVSLLGHGRHMAVISDCMTAFGTLPSLAWLSYDRPNDTAVCDGGRLGGIGRPTVMKDGRLVVSAAAYRMPTEWRLYEGGEQRAELFEVPAVDPLWLPGRDLLVAQVETPAGDLLILDPDNLTPRRALPAQLEGRLAGYDRLTDNLYFVTDSRVIALSFAEAEKNPPTPARATGLRRTGSGDQLLDPSVLVSLNAPNSWHHSVCRASQSFKTDQTAICAPSGRGVYRTQDGGRSYQTAMRHLPSWAVRDLQISTAFPRDRTVLLTLEPRSGVYSLGERKDTLYRSHDAGDTWVPSGMLTAIAPAPDLVHSRTFYAFGYGGTGGPEPSRAFRSTDSGATWQRLGELPDPGTAVRQLYAVAQPGSQSPVLLAIGGSRFQWSDAGTVLMNPKVYRSTDGGLTWSVVLSRDGSVQEDSLMVVRSAVAGTALLLDEWYATVPAAEPPVPDQRTLPKTLRSYDLGATWHYVYMEDLKRPLATDDDGNLIGADPDKPAVAIYTLATATPRPSATSSR
ncbi:MAG: WD40/YVTN/BNR-like repeat-containing protein [Anaerolineae bacterium]